MTSDEAVSELKKALNRPDADDFFSDPDDYYSALSKAQSKFYRLTADHYPEILRVEHADNPISSTDGGRTYQLGGDHLGEMEVWTPPGPPQGRTLLPAVPEADRMGFYVEGQDLKLTFKKDYSPGIYVRWVPADVPSIDDDTDPTLPRYFDDALIFRAAYHMASKPGFLGDPHYYKQQANEEWSGDPEVPSDGGILSILSNQSAHGGYKVLPDTGTPWYDRITTGN